MIKVQDHQVSSNSRQKSLRVLLEFEKNLPLLRTCLSSVTINLLEIVKKNRRELWQVKSLKNDLDIGLHYIFMSRKQNNQESSWLNIYNRDGCIVFE